MKATACFSDGSIKIFDEEDENKLINICMTHATQLGIKTINFNIHWPLQMVIPQPPQVNFGGIAPIGFR